MTTMRVTSGGFEFRGPWGKLSLDATGLHIEHSEQFKAEHVGWTAGDYLAEADRLKAGLDKGKKK